MQSNSRQSGAETGWRVGVLYSRTGVTAATGSEHFYGTVLAIEEINAAGGVDGRLLDPVAYDARSDPDEYHRLASRMLQDDDVTVISDIWGGQLCKNDRFRVLEHGMSIPSAYCRMGSFEQYVPVKK